MREDRRPDYDFFLPARPTSPRPASPEPTIEYPVRYGAAPNPPGAVPSWSGTAQPNWADHLPAVRRSGMPSWLIAVILVPALLIGVGILAAIAIPVFLNQRMKAELQATTVQLPATFNGQTRNTGPEAQALAKSFALGGIGTGDVAIYGPVGRTAVVIVAMKPPAPMSEAQQRQTRKGFEQGFASRGRPLSLVRQPDAGDLGGWIGCGDTVAGVHVCLATSTGSMVSVVSAADGDPVALLRQARAAAVTRS